MAKKPVKYFVADAFTDSAFKGNPAAVCVLEEERDEKWLQALAAEFNLPLTCYLIRINHQEDTRDSLKPPKFSLRWFIYDTELCGHGTLAAAHILFSSGLVINSNSIEFSTLSGILTAKMVGDINPLIGVESPYFIELDFPTIPLDEVNYADVSSISKALNANVASIVDIKMFQVNSGYLLDHVCGSAHCALATYWAKKLGKSDFVAYAASSRSGILNIHLDEHKQRVLLRGKAVTTMEGVVLV